MELAINYSPQAAGLLAGGAISIERFKCSPWPDLIAEAADVRPVYVHFDLRDHRGLTADDWPSLEWVLARIAAGVWARPWVVACEYGGVGPLFAGQSEAHVIAADLPRLAALVHNSHGA